MDKNSASRGDLTTGVIWKKLIRFAIPLLLSSLVQQLYNTVGLLFAGNMIDSAASAAIGGLANVLFDWLFIRVMPDGVRAVAWATLFSQTVSAIYVVRCLTRLNAAYII